MTLRINKALPTTKAFTTKTAFVSNFRSFTYFDEPAVPPPPAPPVVPPPPPPPPAVKMFTQPEVDKIMAEHRKNLQAQNSELVAQLETLKTSSTLTAQQKEDLEARIETLSKQHMTKEQQLAADLEKVQKKAKAEQDAAVEESKKWKSAFETTLINNELIAGAVKHKAASAIQIQQMFGNKAKVVPDVDDAGQPTGGYVVKLPVQTIDAKTKKPVILELNAQDAIGKIRENQEYSNLFLFEGVPGLGGNNHSRPQTGPVDFSTMTPEEYRKYRSENKG